ncbi:MAG: hypothetical protein IPG84_10750, partial [Betaproteobacteria bacterium]|nr:hypothetical protein [Betaproteobacteria bacterium]
MGRRASGASCRRRARAWRHRAALARAGRRRLGDLASPARSRGSPTAPPPQWIGDVSERVAALLRGRHAARLRPDDLVGVEVGGAVKNVLAIAKWWPDGACVRRHMRAALITRGLAEMSRLAVAGREAARDADGARPAWRPRATHGRRPRNRRVGLGLAQ